MMKRRRPMMAAMVAGLFFVNGACTSIGRALFPTSNRKKPVVEGVALTPPKEAPHEYKKGVDFLRAEDYHVALAVLDEFISENPTSEYVQLASWQSGRALEGLGRWSEAADRYRSVAQACDGVAPKLQAMAFYRLSFVHEAMGDDQQTTAVLIDLQKRAEHLPPEIARAELPARLAAAYARVGNFDRAVAFYEQAEGGVNHLRRSQPSSGVSLLLARTLYYMGSMSLRHVTWKDFESAFRPLARSQIYLLEASDLGVDPWSDLAAKDLIATYQDLWKTLSEPPKAEGDDTVVIQREIQAKQWQRAQLIRETMEELKARVVESNKVAGRQSQSIRDFITEMEKRTALVLTERPAGEGLTPAAQNRKRAVRGNVVPLEGKIDDSLERRFIESSKQSAQGESGIETDPNL